jgi:hypothetical protein
MVAARQLDDTRRMRSARVGRVLGSTILLGLSLYFVQSPAWADPSAADKETARRLMTEGRTRRKANDWKGAAESFLAADAIMHVPTTGLEAARAEIQLGQLVEARDKLLEVVRLPEGDNEPRAFTDARAAAKALSADLTTRIPSITIKLQGAPQGASVKVTVDGVEVPPASLIVPRAVDPGHHTVAGRVAEGPPHDSAVDVAEGETKEVSVDLAAVPASSPEPDEAPAATADSGAPKNKWRTAGFIGFGVGGAGLILGSITGLLAISDFNSAKSQGCVGNNCSPTAYPDLNKAGTMATLSTVGFIVAGAGVGVGFVGLVVGKRPPSRPAPDASPDAKPDANPSTNESMRQRTNPPSFSFDLYFGPAAAGVRGSF